MIAKTSLLAALAAVASMTAATPALADDEPEPAHRAGFGSHGVIVSAERLIPLVTYGSYKNTDPDGSSTTESRVGVAFLTNGPLGGLTTTYNIPRLAFDFVVVPNLTIGGAAWVYSDLSAKHDSSPAHGPSQSEDQAKFTYWGFAPRIGYVAALSDTVALWPRAGIEYHSLGTGDVTRTSGGQTTTDYGSTTWQLAADLEAMLVITPWNHFGFAIGPTADIPISGKTSSNAPSTGTTPQSIDVAMLQIGLTGGVLGYF
jgi:hypothetical protein